METLFSNTLPLLFSPLFSLLTCVLLPLYALRGLPERVEHRWFTILCALAIAHNLSLIFLITFPLQNPLIGLVQFLYPLFVFMLPLSIELYYSRVSIRRPRWLVPTLMTLSVCLTAAMWFRRNPMFISVLAALYLPLIFYALINAYRAAHIAGRTNMPLVGGVVILTALCALSFMPLNQFMYLAPLSMVFIPVMLIAVGLTYGEGTTFHHTEIRRKIFISAALAFIGIPLTIETIIVLYHGTAINRSVFWNWVSHYGIISIVSIVSCLVMVPFSMRRSAKQPGAIIFAIICLLWTIGGIQEVFPFVFPEKIALQAVSLIDVYLFALVGFLAHFILVLSGRPRSKAIAVFYIVSFALMMLNFLPANAPPLIYQYPGGPFIMRTGPSYHLFVFALLAVLSMGTYVFSRLRRSTHEGLAHTQYTYLLLACMIAIVLLLGTLPCMVGVPCYPLYQLAFIPLIIVAYGVYYRSIVSISVRRAILTNLIRVLVMTAYAVIILLCAWVLKDYSLPYIFNRIVPYGLPPLFTSLCAAFLSLIILGLEQNRPITLLFSIVCLALCMLHLDIALLTIVNDPALALSISRLDHFFLNLLILGCLLHLTWLATETRKHWWIVLGGYAVGITMAPLALTDYYFSGMYHYYWGFFAKAAILYRIISIVWGMGLLIGIALIIHSYRRSDNPDRKTSLRYLTYGFVVMIILSFTDNLALNGVEVYPLGNFGFIPLMILAYALFKHNLSLSLQNLRAFLAVALQMACMLAIVMIPQTIVADSHRTLMLYAGLLSAFFLYKPIRHAIHALLNLFIRSLAEDLKQQYYSLTQRLSQAYHIREIEAVLTQWFFQTTMTSRCVILIRSGDKQFEGPMTINPQCFSGMFASGSIPEENRNVMIAADHRLMALCSKDIPLIGYDAIEEWVQDQGTRIEPWMAQTEIILPVYLQDYPTAVILLGAKINGVSYSRAEQEILHDLGPVLGPNLENARLLEGLEMEVDRRTKDLNTALIDSLIKEKEISASNAIITRQNEIFRSLLETSTKIHQIWKLDELFTYTLEHIHTLFPELGFGIILEGGRSDVLESIAFVGISDPERDIILADRDRLLDDAIAEILVRDMLAKGVIKDTDAHGTTPHWTVLPLQLATQRVIGKMIVKGDLDQASREVITVFLGQLSTVTQGKLLMRELEKMANTDGLTGAYNRTYFNQEFMQAIVNATRYNIPFAIIMVDVNGLKQVNDRFGHERGDEMIVRVARLLMEVCRKTDVVARLGGDEFAALMPSTNRTQAERVVERLRAMEEHMLMACRHKDGSEEFTTIRISIGLSASDETPPDDVLKEADKRMYQDKELFYAGRERYR